jgi:hypothetical protein
LEKLLTHSSHDGPALYDASKEEKEEASAKEPPKEPPKEEKEPSALRSVAS